MKLLKKGQSGQALVMALILLALGSLITVPILNLAGTSLNYNQIIQRNTLETYAADSGVEYALCELGNDPELYQTEVLQASFTKNDRTVDVTVEYLGDYVYKVTSVATTDSTSSTTIESQVHIPPYPAFFNNAITSMGDITIQPAAEVYGDVQYNGTLDNKGTIYGNTTNHSIVGWPTVEQLSTFYWVEAPVINESSVDISSGSEAVPYPIGPARTSGDLTTTGSGVAELNGTLYVQGSLTLMPDTAIINFQPGSATYGPGCIIAVGDINFQPNLMTAAEAYIFVMSVAGSVQFQPGNDFYGSLAGDIAVNLQPISILAPEDPGGGLEFPPYTTLETVSYEIR